MDYISVFLSYSSTEKKIGGKFKSYLTSYCGYETFIAHDDIPGSSVWEEAIIKGVKNADFFIPLISDTFKQSDFTDQETGIAVYLKKKIIPVKLDKLNPYGFINKYQALQYKTKPSDYYYNDNINELALTIAQIGLGYDSKIIHQKALNSIIRAFCESKSFSTANATIQIICRCIDFSSSHLQQMKKAIESNDQIIGAFGLSRLKTFLNKTYKLSID